MNRQNIETIEKFLEELSVDLHGQLSEYSEDTVIITVPINVDETEFQGIKGSIIERVEGVHMVILTGTICTLHDHTELDFKDLLKKNYQMLYSKITITDEDYLEVEAATRYDYATAEEVEEMIKEVAVKTHELKEELLNTDVKTNEESKEAFAPDTNDLTELFHTDVDLV